MERSMGRLSICWNIRAFPLRHDGTWWRFKTENQRAARLLEHHQPSRFNNWIPGRTCSCYSSQQTLCNVHWPAGTVGEHSTCYQPQQIKPFYSSCLSTAGERHHVCSTPSAPLWANRDRKSDPFSHHNHHHPPSWRPIKLSAIFTQQVKDGSKMKPSSSSLINLLLIWLPASSSWTSLISLTLL